MHHNVKRTLYYIDTKAQTNFLGSVEKYLKNQSLYHFFPFDRQTSTGGVIPCIVKYSSLPDVYQNIIKDIFDTITAGYQDASSNNVGYTKQIVKNFIESIAKTSILQTITLTIPNTNTEFLTLYTPEEKLIAVDTLKALLPTLELRKTWYDKVTRVMGDESKYSIEDLEAVLADLEK